MRANNLTLLTDLYELTMMQGYFKNPTNQTVIFDMFYRTNPCGGAFAITAGLEQMIEYIENLKFTDEDIEYLRSLNTFEEDFLEYLSNFRFTGDIYAIPEGTVVFPREPLVKVVAPIMEAQLVETAILNIINHQSLIATKAARVCYAAKGDAIMEFGLRRAQGPDAGIFGARAAIIGGCAGTSCVLTGKMFDVPVLGTHAHSWIMSFPSELEAFRTQSNPDVYPNVDWWDEALRDHSYGNNVTFSARGGGEFVRYFTQLNYLNDNGILEPTSDNDGYSTQFKYSKLNIRTNLDITVSPTTTVQLNLFGNFSEHNRPGETTSNIFSALYQVPSGAFPVKTSRNVWGGTTVYSNNPIASISGRGYARSQTRNMYADMKLNQDLSALVKGLSVGFQVGLDNSASYWDNNTMNFGYEQATMNWETGETTYNTLRNEGTLSFSKSVGSSVNHFNFGAYANYAKDWNKHSLVATLQYNMDKTNAKGQNNSKAFMDVVAQAHYVYDHRYVLDASLSGSAASILEPGHRWGIFPSVGAAWIMSEEAALKSDWLNLLKLRASYGISGRADYGTDLYLDVYGTGGSYYFGKNPASISGMKITQLGITDMTYEKSHKLNVGFDFIAFNKLSVTIDGFYDHRTDILVSGDNAVSSIFGLTAPNINNGVVNSYGVETSVRWADKIGDFNYQIGGMLTFNRNKIINQNEEYRPHDYLKRTGKRLGQFFGYEVEGIYQSQEEIDNRGVKQNLSDVRPGDLKYKDQNNDGVVDAYDQVALGYSAMPEIYYSFDLNLEYKGFGIYALFQGTGNQSRLLNTSSVYWPLISNSTISTEYYNNRWTPDTPNAKYPRLTSEGSANNYTTNSLWVADASYMKLRTLELYYNFSQEMMKKSKFIKGAKVFARGHDLFCVDKIKVLDPENIGTNHPTMTQYTFGVNLSF